MQFMGFNCVVVNGSNLVRAVWKINVGTVTGTFVAGESLKWPGAGGANNGVFLFTTGSGGQLYLYMTVDTPEPAIGDTIYGVTSTATAVIASMPAISFPDFCGNPPRFADSPEQGTIATNDIFFISGQPPMLVGATIDIKRASFRLSSVWGGSTFNETTVGLYPQGRIAIVARDREPTYGFPLLGPSDKFSGEVYSEAIRRIAAQLAAGGGAGAPTSWSALALTSPWVQRTGAAIPARSYYPASDVVRLKGVIETNSVTIAKGASILSGANVLPSGSRPAENLEVEVGGGEVILVKTDGSITYEGPGGLPVVNLNTVSFRADGT
jgi:hypothetical protein